MPESSASTSTSSTSASAASSSNSQRIHSEDVLDSEEVFRGVVVEEEEVVVTSSEYYEHLEPDEQIVEEEEAVGGEIEDVRGVDRDEMQKIKRIQHQKMLLVHPMAQKRHRGRPPAVSRRRGAGGGGGHLEPEDVDDDDDHLEPQEEEQEEEAIEEDVLIDDDEEMLMLETSGGLDAPSESIVTSSSTTKKADHPPPAPRHLVNKANSRGRPANPIPPHRRPLPKDLVPPPGAGVLKRGASGIQQIPAKRRHQNPHHHLNSHQDAEDVPPLLHPPRGGPVSNLILDSMAPEGSMIQNQNQIRNLDAEKTMASEDKMEMLHTDDGVGGGDAESYHHHQHTVILDGDVPPDAIEEVVIGGDEEMQKSSTTTASTSSGPKQLVEKKAGLDLPAEHFPKDPAGHVATRGLHPIAATQTTTSSGSHLMTYEMLEDGEGEDVVVEEHHVEEGEEEMEMSQQRVLTLQDGSFIEDRIGRADEMEDEETRMLAKTSSQNQKNQNQKANFITVQEENGMNVVYQVEEAELEEHQMLQEVEEDVQEEEVVVEEEVEYVLQEDDDEQMVHFEPTKMANFHHSKMMDFEPGKKSSTTEQGDEHQMKQEIIDDDLEHRQEHQQMNSDDDDDDDMPPQLIPEGVAGNHDDDDVDDRERQMEKEHHQQQQQQQQEMNYEEFGIIDDENGGQFQFCNPDGSEVGVRLARDDQGNQVFIDEHGQIVELITDSGAVVDPSLIGPNDQIHGGLVGSDGKMKREIGEGEDEDEENALSSNDRANMDFMSSCNFLDRNNICCGLCGEIVQYDKLISEHLPNAHPETQTADMQLEEVPYTSWLKDRLQKESKMMENGFRQYHEDHHSHHHHHQHHDSAGFGGSARLYSRSIKQMRKVSQIRVNVNEMTMAQLENALKRKLVEKMNRKVPVSLVDRLHARCDICQAVVSLNKKFEVVHLVRHFNAWHPAEHRCSQDWKQQQHQSQTVTSAGSRRALSLHDFAVVSTDTDQNNLQCIWCGMLMDRAALGMHFSEIHSQQILVPNCSLCLQEMVMTARLMEKHGEDFGISLPDEFHLQSAKLGAKFSSEKALDKAIVKYIRKAQQSTASGKSGGASNQQQQDQQDGGDDDEDDDQTISVTNSQQSFGRRNRLKRKFVKPCFRQICPTNSEFFIAKSACEWRCRLCDRDVYGAVISAGAIKHYKEFHPADIDKMQYELVKARLDRIGDGSMEFVHPQLVECLICNLTYALHKPFNICRAIRHLRLKHPEVMPETSGKSISGADVGETTAIRKPANPSKARRHLPPPKIRFGDTITDPIELEKFRKENYDQHFDKVQVVYGIKKNDEPAFILLMENEQMDEKTAVEMAEKLRENSGDDDEDVDVKQRHLESRVEEDEEDEDPEDVTSSSRGIYRSDVDENLVVEVKPSSLLLDGYHQGSGELEQDEEEHEEEGNGGARRGPEEEYVATYDANNPDHVLIEENDILGHDNYEEMIQEEGDDYQDLEEEDSRTVRYLTEEEIREAQARGEILEFEDEVFEEEDYPGQQ